MSLTLDVNDDAIFDTLGAVLAGILPLPSQAVLQGQSNRVPEPGDEDYLLMIPLRRKRLSTNVDHFEDDAWQGAISGGTMTVTKMLAGTVQVGATPGANATLLPATKVGMQISGDPGGLGTYVVTPSQTVAADTIFQAGGGFYLQPTQITVQLEVHGPNSADNAQIISTMLRDEYAYDAFTALNVTAGRDPTSITPLYADDPKQLPFNNDQTQVENRWVIECELQANITVRAFQQFADQIIVGLKNVDVTYPPS